MREGLEGREGLVGEAHMIGRERRDLRWVRIGDVVRCFYFYKHLSYSKPNFPPIKPVFAIAFRSFPLESENGKKPNL